ncbi:Protein kinase-like domain protein [Moelleriella libera RCEF 2490]|uniref:non-specific serine/threonine protein kinase n=1 Tax=Moelleriella libera RCEF 2490 TaxID=1081109 RepID=A0A167WG97_9HYPO|nr:Protein kinase-like domain protein [Moelleriella libera RCEF 2490]
MENREAFRLYPDESSGVSSLLVLQHRLGQPARKASLSNRTRLSQHERAGTAEPRDEDFDKDDYLPRIIVPFSELPFTIGRDSGNKLSLEHPTISAKHCTIALGVTGSLTLHDHSTYGTKVGLGNQWKCYYKETWAIGKRAVVKDAPVALRFGGPFQFRLQTPEATIPHHCPAHELCVTDPIHLGLPDIFAFLKTYSVPNTMPPSGAATPLPSNEVKFLGSGGFGVVELLRNPCSGKCIVRKTPKKGLLKTQREIALWMNEATLTKNLKHVRSQTPRLPDAKANHLPKRNIVQIHSHTLQPPAIYMDFAPLGALDNQKDISSQECIFIMQQLASALEFVHSKGIFHRDIKPENVLVSTRTSQEIVVWLSDFGLAKDMAHSKQTICGTFTYLAVEVLSRSYSAAIDVWSLGVVLLEIYSGLPKLNGFGLDTQADWCDRIAKKARLEMKNEAKPNTLPHLLGRMLLIEPQSRLTSSECYFEALSLCDVKDCLRIIPGDQAQYQLSPAVNDLDDQTRTIIIPKEQTPNHQANDRTLPVKADNDHGRPMVMSQRRSRLMSNHSVQRAFLGKWRKLPNFRYPDFQATDNPCAALNPRKVRRSARLNQMQRGLIR